jgi:antitoxin VapB
MAMNIKNEKVEQLADELAHITGESKTAVILRALDFLENEIWSHIPRKLLGRPVTKREREQILGYGRGGV